MSKTDTLNDEYVVKQRARRRTPLPDEQVRIRRPKQIPEPPGKPSLLSMLPMLVMALSTGAIAFFMSSGTTGGSRAILTVVPMALMASMMMAVQQFGYRRNVREHQAKVQSILTSDERHLSDVAERLRILGEQQRQTLTRENPSLEELNRRVQNRAATLWERQPTDDDFLAVRIGTATLPLCIDIKMPENDDEDPRLTKAQQVVEALGRVPDLPVMANLDRLGSVGLRGQRTESLYLCFAMVANIITHHSPDDVRLYVFSHRRDAEDLWSWLRWLPHTQALSANARQISLRKETDEPVLLELSQTLRQRADKERGGDSRYDAMAPHMVVIFDQSPEMMGHKVIQMLLDHDPSRDQNELRASAIFVDHPIPPQVSAMINMRKGEYSYHETWGAGADQVHFEGMAETANARFMAKLARSMAPLRTETSLSQGKGSLPRSVRLIEVLGATRAEQLDLNSLYSDEYDPRRVLSFPVGRDTDLKPMMLTLREAGQGGFGSHAILAGTTGTGKSVLLQSMVLSMALTNSPEHVNFVLADFKGGASELAKLQALPHVVGFVTDLNAALVERFRIALESEVLRRKQLFDSAKVTLGSAVANIRTYNRLRPDDPLPHLVIVLDEFAHGKTINPDFQSVMDMIAAQGRALGMHLILSTQRATDFDQKIRPNIDVRISLRVASMEESKAIFNRAEAYSELQRPGQAYIQVGDNELFEMFQAARADVAYQPDETRNIELLDEFKVYRFGPDGRRHLLYRHKLAEEKENGTDNTVLISEAEVLVDLIAEHCQDLYPLARIICLPPLPQAEDLPLLPLLSRLPTYGRWDQGMWVGLDIKERLRVPIGMLDLPAAQDQRPFVLDLGFRDGNFVVIGASGSGRLLFLQSLILGLASTHSPEDVNIYVLSRGPTLSVFANMPHCGAVIQPSETERIDRLMKFLEETIDDRRAKMNAARAPSMEALRLADPDTPIPAIIVVFEDFGGFRSDHQDEVLDLIRLAGDAKQVDVHLVFAASSIGLFHRQLQDNLRNRLALGPLSYGEIQEILGERAVTLEDIKGRGYLVDDQRILECQIASPARQAGIEPETDKANSEIAAVVKMMEASWQGQTPVRIDILPLHITIEELWQVSSPAGYGEEHLLTASVGLDYDKLEDFRLNLSRLESTCLVVGPARSGKTEFLLTTALCAAKSISPDNLEIVVFALRKNHLASLQSLPHIRYAGTVAEAEQLLHELAQDLNSPEGSSVGEFASEKHRMILVDDLQRFVRAENLPGLLDQLIDQSEDGSFSVFLAETGANLAQIKGQFHGTKFIASALRASCGISFSLEQNELSPFGSLQFRLKRPFLQTHEKNFGRGRGIFTCQGSDKVVQVATVGSSDSDEADYVARLDSIVRDVVSSWQQLPMKEKES